MTDATEISPDRPAATRPTTVKEIIDRAGGAPAIAEATAATDNPLSVDAIYKWQKNGIPDRHWNVIRSRCDVTTDELFAANEAARAPADVGQG